MMRRFTLETQPVDIDSDPLIVYGSSATPPSELILFVHGLNGHRINTWGQFPQLFLNCGKHDVGLYGYETGFTRIKSVTATFDQQAEELAHQLRDCNYSQIVLIGHSMGGLLSMAATQHLIDTKATSTVNRIASFVLIGTPQAGSTKVPIWATWLSRDLRLLRAHSERLTDIQRRFIDHVVVSMFEQSYGHRVVIPTFAVIGTRDRWVSDLSATLRVPSDQTKRTTGKHTEIAKPTDDQSEVFKFVSDRVAKSLAFHRDHKDRRRKVGRRLSEMAKEGFNDVDQLIAISIIGEEDK